MKCHGKKLKGSGYTKPAVADNSFGADMQKLLAARNAQDAHYFPMLSTVVTSAHMTSSSQVLKPDVMHR